MTVRFQLNGDGHIAMDRVELVTNGGPVGEAEKQAFEAARNAVLRCEGEGYDIPGLSRPMDIELAFDPTAPAEPRQ
ncbi:hypothetical protein EKE94_06165 [Mesobaculum littorinae]|uniref:TonB C-terminal domain-containing protein n=1 Tax=Mesobaculum littorinae TaxID=2486419 RepID=A0A438AII1_9RHOB|nr:hypothetical protein [Mesobaculum littorinae]RVV98500.1 hypothetical protein EKE94_06165 [Mesobaculum littorinae]